MYPVNAAAVNKCICTFASLDIITTQATIDYVITGPAIELIILIVADDNIRIA